MRRYYGNSRKDTLRIGAPLRFQQIEKGIEIRGNIVTSDLVEMEFPDSVTRFGPRDDERQATIVGDDNIDRQGIGILNVSHLNGIQIKLRSTKFVDIGTVGYVNLPRFPSISPGDKWIVAGLTVRPRSPGDSVNIVFDYTLGYLGAIV